MPLAPGTYVEIKPTYSDGIEADDFGHCCGWVVECASEDVLVDVQGRGEFWVTRRRVAVR